MVLVLLFFLSLELLVVLLLFLSVLLLLGSIYSQWDILIGGVYISANGFHLGSVPSPLGNCEHRCTHPHYEVEIVAVVVVVVVVLVVFVG